MKLIDVDALKGSIEKDTCPVNISYFYRKMREAPTIEVPGWISVKDKSRRPKDGEQVWCYGSGYFFTAYYDEVQETDYGLNPFGFYELHINPVSLGAEDEEYIESCATHWMPLPKQPEVEE